MKPTDPYLPVEGQNKAVVDFLSHNASVELTIEDGELRVVVKSYAKDDSSSWAQEEWTATLERPCEAPEADDDDE